MLVKITYTYKNTPKTYLREFNSLEHLDNYLEKRNNKQQSLTYKILKKI